VTVAPGMTWKIRKSGFEDRYTPSEFAPGPLMVTFLSITSSSLVSPMFRPFRLESKMIVSPLCASASAWRNDPGPLSLVLVTLVVGVAVGVGLPQDNIV